MATQKSFEYANDGWPVLRAVEVSKYTPEEHQLSEALNILTDVLQVPMFPVTKLALHRVQDLTEQVFKVVSDYSHMKAKIEELETDKDSLEARIAELEETIADTALERVDEPGEDSSKN